MAKAKTASSSARSSTFDAEAVAGVRAIVKVADAATMMALLGERDEFLKLIDNATPGTIHVRGDAITVSADTSEQAQQTATVFHELLALISRGQTVDKGLVRQVLKMLDAGADERPSDILSEALVTHRGRTIRPKTLGQKRYLDAIRANTVTFGIGPAGTGKTYLAMGAAVQALRSQQVNRLILTRPAVEAGEKLGFLPGTLHEKIDPYLKPLWDALHDMMDAEELINHVDRGTIEVAPLAFMRGRTLNDAFIVLDEAQNTTPEQMKMFLTRIGFNARAVITGDVSQIDLPHGKPSGLQVVRNVLHGIDGVAFAELGASDVVRHPIVQRIVEAYESYDQTAAVDQQAPSPKTGE